MSFSQGDILKLDFSPTLGHEQAEYRPAIVISRRIINQKTGLITVCPITGASRRYPTWVSLGGKGVTERFIMCEQIQTIDAIARNPKLIEKADSKIFDKVLAVINSIVEKEHGG